MVCVMHDLFGNPNKIKSMVLRKHLTSDDAIVVIGDAGINCSEDYIDNLKVWAQINKWHVPVLCVSEDLRFYRRVMAEENTHR